MRSILVVATLLVSSPVVSAAAASPEAPMITGQSVEHGGGCRKSSPPGQCCHMEKATGTVHCH